MYTFENVMKFLNQVSLYEERLLPSCGGGGGGSGGGSGGGGGGGGGD